MSDISQHHLPARGLHCTDQRGKPGGRTPESDEAASETRIRTEDEKDYFNVFIYLQSSHPTHNSQTSPLLLSLSPPVSVSMASSLPPLRQRGYVRRQSEAAY